MSKSNLKLQVDAADRARCFSSCAWNLEGADVRLEASRMASISLEQLFFGAPDQH
jgi:hypothetical protein